MFTSSQLRRHAAVKFGTNEVKSLRLLPSAASYNMIQCPEARDVLDEAI